MSTHTSAFRDDIFKDKVALVTGGATGLGKEIARSPRAGTVLDCASRAASKRISRRPVSRTSGRRTRLHVGRRATYASPSRWSVS